jgi:hypothetical protein
MRRTALYSGLGVLVTCLGLAAGSAHGQDPRLRANGTIDVNRPRSPFDCDTPIGRDWFGSSERCLAELCAGENVTNAHVVDARGNLRRNPCAGRDPFELSR